MKYCMFLLYCSLLLITPAASSSERYELNHGLQLLNQERDSCNLNHTCLNESGEDEESTCPVWFLCNVSKTCQCGPTLRGIIKCDEDRLASYVMNCFCVTTIEGTGDTIAGACFANCAKTLLNDYDRADSTSVYHLLPKNKSRLNSDMCGHMNRDGELCGKCKEDYYPMAYSYNQSCVRCENGHRNWWLYIIAAYLPLTFFYFFVLFFKISVTSSSHLHGYVFFSQAISMLPSAQLTIAVANTQPIQLGFAKASMTFLGIWNLDFFRAYTGICLKLGTLPVLALDYTIAMYPFILTFLSYLFIELHDRNFRLVVFIWKPFRQILMLFRRNWDSRTSIIDAYSTFFLLSYIKSLSVTAFLLIPTKIYHLRSNETSFALFYDATKSYFGKEHLPFAIIALIALTAFNILPVVILFLYQFSCFQKILRHLPIKHHILNSFVDTFQGCYKDGTEPGTRDCRWFSGMFLLVRLVGYVVYGVSTNVMYYTFASILLLVLVMMLVTIQPYKPELAYYTPVNVVFIIFLIILYTSNAGIFLAVVNNHHFTIVCTGITAFVVAAALVYFSVYTVHWLLTRWRLGLEIVTRIRLLRQGYEWLETGGNRQDSLPDRLRNSHLYHHRNMANFNNAAVGVKHCCSHAH